MPKFPVDPTALLPFPFINRETGRVMTIDPNTANDDIVDMPANLAAKWSGSALDYQDCSAAYTIVAGRPHIIINATGTGPYDITVPDSYTPAAGDVVAGVDRGGFKISVINKSGDILTLVMAGGSTQIDTAAVDDGTLGDWYYDAVANKFINIPAGTSDTGGGGGSGPFFAMAKFENVTPLVMDSEIGLSVVRDSAGIFTATFDVAQPDANYVVLDCGPSFSASAENFSVTTHTYTTTTFKIQVESSAGVASDTSGQSINIAVMRSDWNGAYGGDSNLIFQGQPSADTTQFDSDVFTGRQIVNFTFYGKVDGTPQSWIRGPFLNGDINQSNYDGVNQVSDGTTVTSSTTNMPAALGLNGGGSSDGEMWGSIEIKPDGSGAIIKVMSIEDDGSGNKVMRTSTSFFDQSIASLTQISFTADTALGIDSGSRLTIMDPIA